MLLWRYSNEFYLSQLCQRMEPFYPSPPSRVLKLFRDFWLYCILLGFSDSEKGMSIL